MPRCAVARGCGESWCAGDRTGARVAARDVDEVSISIREPQREFRPTLLDSEEKSRLHAEEAVESHP